jgi:transcriptional regulator with XRE-family HTH domain
VSTISNTRNEKLRLARRKNMWTMKETADKVGVSLVTYGRWERGIQKPHLGTLKDLCDVFGKSAEELGFGDLSQ